MSDSTATTATSDTCRPAPPASAARRPGWFERHPAAYLLTALFIAVAGLGTIAYSNRQYASEMYGSREPLAAMAQALARGDNYAVFDLNLNIRELRDEHIARLERAPDVVVLGASHWQEAHAGLLADRKFYNSHVHRDYYEDMLGVTELWVRHKKLPRKMIITIRDNLFTPVAERRDHLWLPGIPYYRAMARRLWIEAHHEWETLPVQRWREVLSLQMLFTNAERWHQAPDRPRPTGAARLRSLDLLLPDGSIVWSEEHQRLFTPARAERLSVEFADSNRNRPPKIDPKGVEAIDSLLTYLASRGVTVYLAHPPFNPIYFDRLAGTPYMRGLQMVEQVTRDLADRHGLKIVGSFDPEAVGCIAEQYIDAEHANAHCLGKILRQFAELDAAADHDKVALAIGVGEAPAAQATLSSPRIAAPGKRLPSKRLLVKRRASVVLASAKAAEVAVGDAAGESAARPGRTVVSSKRAQWQRVPRRLPPALRARNAERPVGRPEQGS
jgi:hypothetical protein